MGWRDYELEPLARAEKPPARHGAKLGCQPVPRPKSPGLSRSKCLKKALVSRTGRRRRLRFGFRQPPRIESLMEKLEDCGAVFGNHFPPGKAAEHREINSPEAYASEKNVDAIAQRLIVERIDGMGNGFCTVGVGPAVVHFGVGLVDGHLERGVGHVKRDEFLPVLGTG